MSRKPNIVWVTLDSVRADHTSVGGYHRNTTPELSQLAERDNAVSFEHGIAHSTRTPISVPSMLTGLHPSCHQMMGEKATADIPEGMQTAPDLLSDIGYHTIGVSENNFAGGAKGIDERFDDFTKSSPFYLRDFLTPQLGRSLLKYPFSVNSHGPGFTFDVSAHGGQNSFFTLDIAKRKLKTAAGGDQPIFCYVHFDDPHLPYLPPKAERDDFLDESLPDASEALQFARYVHENTYELIADGLPLSDTEWETLTAMYDAAIKYTDRCVGALVDHIDDHLEDTIVVVTADHGDLLGEYGLLGHHTVLHDALVHVPLVTLGLEGVKRHRSEPTQHVDVMRTLLEVAGAATDQFQGIDLRSETREVAVSQEHRGTVENDDTEDYRRVLEHNPDYDTSAWPQSMVTAARTTEFKLVRTEERTNLYRLPDEETDVSEGHPEVLRELNAYLNDWWETEGQPFDATPTRTDLEEDTKKHLEEMGYLK